MKSSEEMHKIFTDTFDEVLEKGADLLLPYRRKGNENYAAEVLFRINDELDFLPLIRVTDQNGTVKAEQALRSYGQDEFISQIGTVTIGKSYVKIAPRKNFYAEYFDLTPIRLSW